MGQDSKLLCPKEDFFPPNDKRLLKEIFTLSMIIRFPFRNITTLRMLLTLETLSINDKRFLKEIFFLSVIIHFSETPPCYFYPFIISLDYVVCPCVRAPVKSYNLKKTKP